jgi:hypothetical protein
MTETASTAGQQVKTRPIEIGVAWDSRHWTTDVIQIPADTPKDEVAVVCERVWDAQIADFRKTHEHPEEMGYSHVWVYNSMEDERPE